MGLLTVVIPTYNRAPVLRRALESYSAQSSPALVAELIVVDDGSTDETQAVVSSAAAASPFPVRYFRQENRGPAAARNVGIREAKADVILFTDDDIVPSPTLVAEHAGWHTSFPEISAAVLGYVTWAPEVNATPFMQWYGSDGPLFAYARLSNRTEIDHSCFYTCNLSLKTEFLRRSGTFDEDFEVAAYEDLELGYRLHKVGLRLLYNPAALAYHHQRVSFEDACRRAKKARVAWEVFCQKEAGRTQRSWEAGFKQHLKKRLAGPLTPLRSLMNSRVPLPAIVYRTMFAVYR